MRILRWSGDSGVASYDGVTVVLRQPPVVNGLDVAIEQIDYVPHEYAEINGQKMSADHHLKVEDALERMASEARDALLGGSTLVIIHGLGR